MSAAGVLVSKPAAAATQGSFSFVQISDSHIGFSRPQNSHVLGTFAQTVAAINALPVQPAFVVHTGDVTHLAKPEQFDAAKHVLATLRAPLLVLPGQHDVIGSPQAFGDAFKNPRSGAGERLRC